MNWRIRITSRCAAIAAGFVLALLAWVGTALAKPAIPASDQPVGGAALTASGTDGTVASLPGPSGNTAASAARSALGPQSTEYTVQHGDTLWSIAQRFYGAGAEFPRIAEANAGRAMADGRRFTDPTAIEDGWTLQIPTMASSTSPPAEYVVQPGDTLSSIAARVLGSEDRWPELLAANRGASQAGRVLTDATLIWPGLRLETSLGASPTITSTTTEPPTPQQPEVGSSNPVSGEAPSSPARPETPALPSPTPAPAAVGAVGGISCPSGWRCAQLGSSGSDRSLFVWRVLDTDGSIAGRVRPADGLKIDERDAQAKTGLMLRQDTDVDSPFYSAAITASRGVMVEYRPSQGAPVASVSVSQGELGTSMVREPIYLRIERAGSSFSASASSDGSAWRPLAGSQVTIAGLVDKILAGIAITSQEGSGAGARVDLVDISPASSSP